MAADVRISPPELLSNDGSAPREDISAAMNRDRVSLPHLLVNREYHDIEDIPPLAKPGKRPFVAALGRLDLPLRMFPARMAGNARPFSLVDS